MFECCFIWIRKYVLRKRMSVILREGYRMAFSPSDSPLYGGGRIVVTFSDATILPSDAQMYLLFEGSKQRHLTTATLVNQHTVQAAIPGHNEAEDVTLTLWMCHHGNKQVLATSTFFYLYDTAYYMCQFLRDSVFDPAALEELEHIRSEKFDLSEEQLSTLDERLSRAFEHLDIPEGWHVLGLDSTVPEPPPRETLLHFAARLGLQQLATFLMDQTGSEEALRLPNRHGEYPVDIARGLGFDDLAKSLSGFSIGTTSWVRREKVQVTHGSVVTRHGHGMTTLTTTVSKSSNTVGDDLEMLREFTTLIHDEPQRNHYHMDSGILQGRSFSQSDGPAYSRYSNRYSLQLDNRSRAFSDGMALLEQEEEDLEEGEEEDIFSCASTPSPQYHHPHHHHHYHPHPSSPPQYSSSPTPHIYLHQQYHAHNTNKYHSHQYQQQQQQHQQQQQQRRYNKNQRYSPKQGSHWQGFHGDRPQSMPPMTTGIPNISISSLGPKGPILEENLRRLHEISEGIIRLQQHNATQLHIQDGRRENLQKFSTSCPSLNEPPDGTTLANHDSDYYRSMLDLQQDSSAVTPSGDTMPAMDYKNTCHSEIQVVEPDVRICINDVTLDSTDDFIHLPVSCNQYEEDKNVLIEHYRKHPRRKSWCPEKTNVEKKEFRNKMLSVSNRSLSLSSLDGQDDTEDENEEEERLDDSNEMQSSNQSQSSVGGASEASLSHASLNGTLNSSELPDTLVPTANSTPSENNSRLTANRSLNNTGSNSGHSMSDVRLALDEAADQQAADTSAGMPPFGGGHDSDMTSSRGSLVLSGHPTLMKSVSTPSIPSLKEDDKTKAEEQRPGTITEVSAETKSVTRQKQQEVDEDEALNDLLQTDRRRKARMSMIEFLNDTNNFDGGEQKQEVKEEKKRRSSVFSKFGSYRQKKLREKELKSRSTHQFVSVSFSNSKACDVCRRSMANKAALQCEYCMLNVHDSCKDQIAVCAKYRDPSKLPQRTPSAPSEEARDRMTRFQSNSLPASNVFSVPTDQSMKTSPSFREAKRALSVPSRSAHQHSLSTSALLPKNQTQRASSPSKVINEEKEKEHEREAPVYPVSNMTEAFSVSMESLDEGTSEVQDFEDDPVLMIKTKEDEAWSVTVDKKTLKKMSAKDIKRQDHIWEFIQTEKSHCRTLKIMQKIFRHGMLHELNMNQDVIDRVFPRLDDLLDIHLTFLRSLRERQQLRPDKSIDEIGDVLVQQFEGEMGSRMKAAYGEFCSRHNRAVDYYKEILKTERKFQNFVKKCSFNEVCKKLDIPACILLVTQRMTKYPLLIEPIIKTSKGKSMKDVQKLQHALILTRHILDYVDAQIDACEKEERLYNIYYKLDPRTVSTYKGQKFKKSDLLSNGKRKLIHEGVVSWKSARGKSTEVMAVLLSDLIFFMQESNQKYVFYSQDNKSSVIPLSKLLVREKGDTRDSKGIYLICQSKSNPEMYEIVCKTLEERKQWIRIVRSAIANCPEEEESITTEKEEEKRIMEEKSAKLRQLIDVLKQKDSMIKNCCEDKMKALGDMMEILGFGDIMNNLKSVYKDEEKTQFRDVEDLLQAAIQEASRLSMMLQSQTSTLSRSVSSAGEHASATKVSPPLPKRAETFGGFEGKEYPKGLSSMPTESKKHFPAGLTDADSRSGSLQNLENQESDSELLTLTVDGNSSKLLTHRRGSTGQPGPNENSKSTSKEKINRRMSTSFLQNLLIKQHTEREESDTRLSDRSSDRGSWGELSSASSNTSVHHTHHAGAQVNREQSTSLVYLMHYLHAVMSLSAQQKTQMESLKAQLNDTSRKLSKLGSDSERRGTYHHDKQLEELRNLQETINREREAWEKEKERGKNDLEEERTDIEKVRGDIAKQQEDLRLQREELQRQREALQKQIDFYEQQKNSNAAKAAEVSAASKSGGAVVPNGRRSLDMLGPGSSSHNPIEVVHKRSASDDIQTMSRHGEGEPFEPARTEYTGSLKEPLNANREQKQELKQRPHSVSSTTSNSNVGVSRRDSQLPIHLLSATNEQKIKQVKQQFPLKLVHGQISGAAVPAPSCGGTTSGGNGGGGGGSSGNSGLQQMLPMKLSGLSQSGGGHHHGGGTQKSTTPGSHPVLGKSTSNVHISKNSSHPPNRLTNTHSTPSLLSKSRTLQSPPSTQTLLPMKLAEGSAVQRAKSASPHIIPRHGSTNTNNATTAPSHHGQQTSHKSADIKEEEVIYF